MNGLLDCFLPCSLAFLIDLLLEWTNDNSGPGILMAVGGGFSSLYT